MDWNQIFQNTVRAAVGVDAIYFAIAALGLNIQFGYTGLVNFGQAAFMACGSYGLGMTAQYFGIGLWWGIPLGIVFVIILALIVGIPTLRLRADYLAIVTIATAEIVVYSCGLLSSTICSVVLKASVTSVVNIAI